MSEKTWHDYFIGMCYYVSTKSKDRSTKVGCVIVGHNHEILSIGFNGFPRGVCDDIEERHERPDKYRYTEHSERNAIYNAARNGIRLDGSIIYVPWHPCTDCTRAIIQAGIRKVILDGDFQMDEGLKSRWADDQKIASTMFSEAGVEVYVHKKEKTNE